MDYEKFCQTFWKYFREAIEQEKFIDSDSVWVVHDYTADFVRRLESE